MAERGYDAPILMAATSDIGTVRKQNEDFFYYSESGKFFIVCDGMGGHKSGALASKIAGETVRDVLLDNEHVEFGKICEDINEELPLPALKLLAGVRLANRRIVLEAQRNDENRGMGSTIVAVLLYEKWLISINVGDSRIYRLRNSQLSLLTKDHSWINELIEDRDISEKDVQKFHKKNVLTRALGIYPTVKIDLRIENIKQHDLYLLCSDGLHNALSGELIERILSADHKSLQKMVDKLVLSAKQMNGSDNITGGVLTVHYAVNGTPLPTCYEKTIMDEPEKVSGYLDKTLKSLYPLPKAQFDHSSKWMALSGAAIIIVIAFVFLFYRSGISEKTSSGVLASALLTQEISTIAHILQDDRAVKAENAGAVVLLQVKDEKYLKLLKSLNDVRVLDYVKKFNANLPVYAGRFTWAVADSAKRIIYQNNDIRLVEKRRWRRTRVSPPLFETGNTINTNRRQTANNSNQNRGIVYIVGSFDSNIYRNAEIFIGKARLGLLNDYIESGFALRPGNYTISIRDRNGNILKSRANQAISSGDVLAVEF